jgi:hypothetical protein
LQDVSSRLLDAPSKRQCEAIQPLIFGWGISNTRELPTYMLTANEKDKFAMDCLISIFEMLWLSKKK